MPHVVLFPEVLYECAPEFALTLDDIHVFLVQSKYTQMTNELEIMMAKDAS